MLKLQQLKKILKFEYPKTFNVSRSLLFLILIINHILDKKDYKRKCFYYHTRNKHSVKTIGVIKLTSIFLKNSNSSNKLKIIPKQKKMK